MENLWPVDLLSEFTSSDSDWRLLEVQAIAISQATMGLVQGELRRRETSIGRSSSLLLFPTDQPTKGYEFMAIRSSGETFPLVLEVFHLDESHRIWQVRDPSELKRVLREIFTHEGTSRIVRLLAQEAQGARSLRIHDDRTRAKQTEGKSATDTTERSRYAQDDPLRSISVGGLIDQNGKSFAAVILLGTAGFLSEAELQKLVMEPDARGSAVNALNDRFVLTVSFLGSVKMTLSAEELKVLRNQVQQVLSRETGYYA